MTSNGGGYWFVIGAVIVLLLSYGLWRRGLRLYGAIGGVIAIMMLLVGYWSDVEISDTDDTFEVLSTPTLPSLLTDDLPTD